MCRATLTYSMWMDKSHLVRRMSFDLGGVSMVMTMSDYNKPVSITAPPASKIVVAETGTGHIPPDRENFS